MDDYKTFDDSYSKLSDIFNILFKGKKIFAFIVVRDILESLSLRFQSKVTTIEKSKIVQTKL